MPSCAIHRHPPNNNVTHKHNYTVEEKKVMVCAVNLNLFAFYLRASSSFSIILNGDLLDGNQADVMTMRVQLAVVDLLIYL
jgi:hypothetical protein